MKWLVFVSAVVVVGMVVFLYIKEDTLETNQSPVPALTASQEAISAFWQQEISSVGGAAAYQQFKATYNSETTAKKHELAHLFGGELYQVSGLPGLIVCDAEYSFGCYHEFIGQALQAEGIDIVNDINYYCSDFGGCQHGVGHGLLAYFGYDRDALYQALDVCHTLGSLDEFDGCYGGIFMEYNDRSMLRADGVQSRKYVADSYHEVCTQVPDYAANACYFWLPSWLMSHMPGGFEEKFTKVSALCADLELEQWFLTCVTGLASESGSFSPEFTAVAAVCEKNSYRHPLYSVQCVSASARSFSHFMDDISELKRACDSLTTPDEQAFCHHELIRVDDLRTQQYTPTHPASV